MEVHAAGQLRFEEITTLADIGGDGLHTHNAVRDLERRIAQPPLDKALYSYKAKVKSQVSRLVTNTQNLHVLLPHELFAIMHRHHNDEFVMKFLGADGELHRFWADMEGGGHPCLATPPADRHRTIPLQLHGDGVPIQGIGKAWGKLLDIYSMSSLVARGSTRDLMLPIYAIFQHLVTAEGDDIAWQVLHLHMLNLRMLGVLVLHLSILAFNVFTISPWHYVSVHAYGCSSTNQFTCQVLCWSFQQLASGMYSPVDVFGEPTGRAGELAGGYRAVIVCIKGDLDYLNKNLRLNNWSAASPCSLCPANSTRGDPMHCLEFRPAVAQWMTERWSSAEWAALRPDRHRLLRLPSIGIENVSYDYMHCKHLGTDKIVYGSALFLLSFDVLADTPEANFATIWAYMHQWYKDNSVHDHFTAMKLSLICKLRSPHSTCPKVRGKAIEVRNIGRPLLSFWQRSMNHDCMQHRQIELLLRSSVRMEAIVDSNRDKYRHSVHIVCASSSHLCFIFANLKDLCPTSWHSHCSASSSHVFRSISYVLCVAVS